MTGAEALARLTGSMRQVSRQWTTGHVQGVALLAERAAPLLGLDPDRVGLAALLHDVGKAALPEALLTKTGALTTGELAMMQRHSPLGAAMVAAVPGLADLAPIVRAVHERYDGNGYPDGLSGADIPIEARLIAACDTYDALVSDRPYRPAGSHAAARAVLESVSGRQLDPACVEAVLEIMVRRPSSSRERCR